MLKKLLLCFAAIACWQSAISQCPTTLTPATLPVTEGFESYSGPALITRDSSFICGTTYSLEYEQAGTTGELTLNTTTGPSTNTGLNSAIMAGGTGAAGVVNYLYLNVNMANYDTTGNDVFLEFYFADMWDEADPEDRVHVRGSSTDPWVEIFDWSTFNNDGTWLQALVNVTSALKAANQNFSATTQFRWGQNDNADYFGSSSGDGLGIDDINLVQPACNTPSNLTVALNAPLSADLTWTSGGATSAQVSYVLSGTSGPGPNIVNVASGTSVTISNLTGGASYDFYVRDSCSATDKSFWVGPITAQVLCNPSTAPYFNNFDSETDGDLALCWAQYSTRSNGYARVENLGAPRSGAQQLAIYSGSGTSPGDTIAAVSPQFSDLTAGDKQIDIFAKTSNASTSLVIATANSNDLQTATITFLDTFTFASVNVYEEIIYDITTANGYNGTDQYLVFWNNAGTTFDYIYIDDFAYLPIPTCPKVLSPGLASIPTSTTANIAFNANGGTSFDYELGPTGFTQGTNLAGIVSFTTNPLSLTGLAPNTTYDIYLRNDCGGGDTSLWTGPFTFTTDCAAFTAPYLNDFENDPQDVPPTCWKDYETNAGSFVEVENFTGTNGPYSGTQALYLYSSSASTTANVDTLMAFSPQFSDLTAGDKRIRFYANSDDPSSELWIATASASNPSGTITPIDTITFATPDTYEQVIVEFTTANGYNGTDEYIVLWHSLGGTFDYIRIDEFEYQTIPSCVSPLTASMGASNITQTSADLTWTPNNQGGSTYIEVGFVGFTPGSGSQVSLDTVAGNVGTFTATGLVPSGSYEFYVQDDCGANGISAFAGPFAFNTLCAVFSTPYTENFDGTSWTPGTGFANTGFTIDPCWIATPDQNNSNPFKWGPRAVAVGSGSGPLNDNTGGNYLFCESSSPAAAGDIAVILSPSLDLNGLVRPALYIDEHRFGNPLADFEVEITNDFGATWTSIYTATGQIQSSNSAAWEETYINLDSYLGDTVQFRLTQESNGCCGDAAIDNFRVIDGPACPDPGNLAVSGLSDTAASFTWFGGSTATSYSVWVGPRGFYQGSLTAANTGFKVNTTMDSLYTDTLTPNTCYEFVVKSYCQNGDSTDYIGPFQFCTPCSPIFAPYSENFDGTTSPNPTPCWTFINEGSSTTSTVAVSSFRSQSPSNSVEIEYWTGSGELILASPFFGDFDSQKAIRFSVWDDDGTSDLIVGTMSNPLDPTTFTPFRTIAEADMANQAWTDVRVYFGTYTGTDKYVAFSHGQNTTTDQFYIDDFSYENVTCPDPINLTSSARTTTSLTLSWTSGGATSWEVEYGPVGFTPGSGTVVAASTNTNFVLSSLTPGTAYDVYVRDICGPNDKSFPAGPLGEYTDCAAPLAGTYTIGATGDYPSFAAAANALGICGVSAAVTFNVQPGYYNDHLHLQGIPGVRRGIPGISATNTVTFNGSGSDTLEWDGLGTQAAVWIDSVSHVTINNLYIINDVISEGWGVLITDNSDFVNITNNTIFMDTTGAFRSDKAPINVSGNPENDITAGASADTLTITGNVLYGGYYSASLYGESTTQANYSRGLVFSNNEVYNFYLSAVYTRYYNGIEFIGNTVHSTVSVTDEDGLYFLDNDNLRVEENDIYVKDYGIYIFDANDGITVTSNSTVINNMVVSENDYGIYLNDFEDFDVWHNSVVGEPAIRINDQVSADIQNNVFTSTGDFAFESDDNLATADVVNYNLYYSTGANPFDVGTGGVYANLAAWQTGDASNNANSVEGDPIFVAPDDLHLIGGLANDVGNNSLGIIVDIDGDVRPASGSTVVDIGADEYTPVPGDFALKGAEFSKNGFCLRTNDTITLFAENIIGTASDLSLVPLVADFTVTGPVNTSGTITLNTGTIGINDTAFLRAFNIDLSIPGEYTLNAYILPNADNALALNDTLAMNSVTIKVDSILVVEPKTPTVLGANDTLQIVARSPFFGGGDFHITEICQFRGSGNGNPVGGWPSYMSSGVDDYMEITGVPNSDLAGYTLEQYTTSGLVRSYTFPSGTVLNSSGTCILMTGETSKPSEPANFLYDATGTSTQTWSSGVASGHVLKNSSGTIIDAVSYGGFSFPASSGVTAADWSGTSLSGSGSNGLRLEGPDLNDPTNWVACTTTGGGRQDPNTVNTGVIIPAPVSVTGFTWSVGGTTTTTDAVDTVIASQLAPGTYTYLATYNSPCGVYTDSVIVIVPSCFAPPASSLMANAASATSANVGWDTTGLGASTDYEIEFGPIGYTPGTGTSVAVSADSTGTITGLANNICVDVYVRTACSPTDFSPWTGPVRACPTSTPCDDFDAYVAPAFIRDEVSALIIPWLTTPGDAEISTARSQSGAQSLHIHDTSAAGISDVVAYFDTISSGAWNVDFSLYVETGAGAYYNIQQNHATIAAGGTNLWGGDVYFDGSGTATVTYGNPAVVAGTFTYAQGQWIDMTTVIDLDNDTIWIEYNGTSTNIGWVYSIYNGAGAPLQFNGVNFYSGVYATGTYDINYFVDDFCVTPAAGSCPGPNAATVGAVDCDNVDINFTSSTGSTVVQYGAAGFTLGTGTYSGVLTGATAYNIPNLTVGTAYDVYIANICTNGDTSAFVGPLTVTPSGALPIASFTYTVNGFTVNFDGSSSTGGTGLTYSWDFGDGNTGTGVTTSNTYATGGNFNVTLTVTDACGTDDTTIVAMSINLAETALGKSLQVYPNPTTDKVNVEFDAPGSQNATIRVLELSGKEVLEIEANNINGKYKGTVDLKKLARGVYMIEINAGELKANRRLIKN